MWPSLEITPKTINVAGNFVFIIMGTLNRPDLHFEGAGNGPVVITWISREHELSIFFAIRLVSVHVVYPYSSIDTTAAWKKLRFILSVRSDR